MSISTVNRTWMQGDKKTLVVTYQGSPLPDLTGRTYSADIRTTYIKGNKTYYGPVVGSFVIENISIAQARFDMVLTSKASRNLPVVGERTSFIADLQYAEGSPEDVHTLFRLNLTLLSDATR